VVDLAELTFIDSAGLRFLIVLANRHEGPLRLDNAPDSIIRVLALTGLSERFDVRTPNA
jgi:anti-anti-sigma factor